MSKARYWTIKRIRYLSEHAMKTAMPWLISLLPLLAIPATADCEPAPTRIGVVLNFAADGGAAGFYHALERGYFRHCGMKTHTVAFHNQCRKRRMLNHFLNRRREYRRHVDEGIVRHRAHGSQQETCLLGRYREVILSPLRSAQRSKARAEILQAGGHGFARNHFGCAPQKRRDIP